jgi:hypothetical protein
VGDTNNYGACLSPIKFASKNLHSNSHSLTRCEPRTANRRNKPRNLHLFSLAWLLGQLFQTQAKTHSPSSNLGRVDLAGCLVPGLSRKLIRAETPSPNVRNLELLGTARVGHGVPSTALCQNSFADLGD